MDRIFSILSTRFCSLCSSRGHEEMNCFLIFLKIKLIIEIIEIIHFVGVCVNNNNVNDEYYRLLSFLLHHNNKNNKKKTIISFILDNKNSNGRTV